jgi:hypothetical protein
MPVYFIRAGDTGPVKIGLSRDPKGRLKEFDIQSPVPLQLIRVVNGDRHTELYLHKRYKSLWLRGEWFLYCPTMMGDLDLPVSPTPPDSSYRDLILEEALSKREMSAQIAEALGITRAAVSQWRRVPERHLVVVARVTGIPKRRLRPDLCPGQRP